MRRALVALAIGGAALAIAPSDVRADGPADLSKPLSRRGASAAPVTDLDSLLDRCSKMPGLYARFTEERQIALLAVPLRSEGTLHFARGRGLARHTGSPSRQSVLVSEKELVLWDGKTTRRLRLGNSAAVDTFVQSFSLILTANRAALEKSFTLAFQARDGGAWSLSLTPTGADLKKVIAAIELSGHGLEIATLKVRESTGDVSTTRFFDVDVAKRYEGEEADRLFRVPPP